MGRYDIKHIARFYRGKHIAIIGNGPSIIQTTSDGKRLGKVDIDQLLKQVGCGDALPWTINGGWYYHPTSTLGFQMDDVKGPAMAVHPNPDWYASLTRDAQIPIITSVSYDDYPATVSFPLEQAIRFAGYVYFAESISYMIIFAAMCGVKRITLLGVDYQEGCRPQERACTEFWLGWAHAQGIEVVSAKNSMILKSVHEEKYYMPGFYGYNTAKFPLEWKPSQFQAPGTQNMDVTIKEDSLWDCWASSPTSKFLRSFAA